MEQVGISLCIQGTAEKILNGKRTLIKRGTIHVISPIIRALMIAHSDDYLALDITETPANMLNLAYPYISLLAGKNMPIYPVVQLQEDYFLHFKEVIEHILHNQSHAASLPASLQKQATEKMVLLQKQALVMEFITMLLSNQFVNEAKNITHKEQVVMRFLQAFVANPSQRQVAFYAAQANMSQRYFSSIINDCLGMTPIKFITLITINNAKYLLRKEGMQVKQVAEHLGFPEQFTFRKYFKTHTGMSPTEYITQSR